MQPDATVRICTPFRLAIRWALHRFRPPTLLAAHHTAICLITLGLERYWYWVLGTDIGYWIVLLILLGDIFCCSDTQYNTNQTVVSTVHMPVNDYLVLLVTCTLTAAIICLETMLICYCLLNTIIIIIIIKFWDFSWALLCYTLVSVLVLGIGVLDIWCLSWYHSNHR